MKIHEAMEIIEGKAKMGYMVGFERAIGGMLITDRFPEKDSGETLIETEALAWELAEKFALKTKGKCVNIYVIDSTYHPVVGYKEKMIKNR